MSSDDSCFAASEALSESVRDDDAVSESGYDNDAFDDYSDSFESGGESDNTSVHTSTLVAARFDSSGASCDERHASARGSSPSFELGDRVQVHWLGENEWFSGMVTQCDDSRGTWRYFVQYDDGEAQWETSERMRCTPEAAGLVSEAFQQLQQLLPSSDSDTNSARWLLGANVLVYWLDSTSWFPGCVTAVDVNARAIQVEYDDGDVRWESEPDYVNILVHVSTAPAACSSPHSTLPCPLETLQLAAPPAPTSHERVLTPRAYMCALQTHFEPERAPRPYVSVTHTIGSVITVRSNYSERRYLHSTLECTPRAHQFVETERVATRNCLVQTDIPGAMSADNAGRFACSQCN